MTDRERLLEQVREAEERVGYEAREMLLWIKERGNGWQSFNQHPTELETAVAHAGYAAKGAAHHALTALALREAIESLDRDGFTLADYQATQGL